MLRRSLISKRGSLHQPYNIMLAMLNAVEISDIVTRLLLFDTYILDSLRLREVPYLVSAFSADGLRELINSRALQIRCEPLLVAQIGQSTLGSEYGPVLSSRSYRFSVLRIAKFDDFVHRCIQPFHEMAGLPHKTILRLKSTIAENLVRIPEGLENIIQKETNQELRTNPTLFRAAVNLELKRRFGPDVLELPLTPGLYEERSGDFRFETDIGDKLNVSIDNLHNIGQAAGFAVGTLPQRLAEMRGHSALTGFSDVDTELAEKKLGLIAFAFAPQTEEQRFRRVVRLSGFPEIRPEWGERVIDVDKLLKVRESDECRAFRTWLRSTDAMSDKEIVDLISSFRARLGNFASSNPGKMVRFLALTAVGMADAKLGTIAGIVDTFIVEKILPKNGIVAFISDHFPSLFEYPKESIQSLGLARFTRDA